MSVSTSGDRAPNLELSLHDWDAVVRAFHDLFEGLGEVTVDDEGIYFASIPPDVITGIQICKDGRLAASMPLHGIKGSVDRIRWDAARTRLELLGQDIAYTYRIPDELLRHR